MIALALLFEFHTGMKKGGTLATPKFTDTAIELAMPTFTCVNCCCIRKNVTNTVIPRHKLLSFDFSSDEYNYGCCTLAGKKALSIMTSDKTPGPVSLPVYLDFYTDPGFSATKFPSDLPDNIKDYIFSPLNGIVDNAHLISHMKKDGLIHDMELNFSVSDKISITAESVDDVLFGIKKGTKGKGYFTDAKFHPSFISLMYGNNAKCCFGKFKHPCLIQSHEMVRTICARRPAVMSV
jgi:hypothetical protein